MEIPEPFGVISKSCKDVAVIISHSKILVRGGPPFTNRGYLGEKKPQWARQFTWN
jgi:hypothetical protein